MLKMHEMVIKMAFVVIKKRKFPHNILKNKSKDSIFLNYSQNFIPLNGKILLKIWTTSVLLFEQ